MPDNLTEIEGQTSFAYNVQRGHPWHMLGTAVSGDMGIEMALEKVGVRLEYVEPRDMFIMVGKGKSEDVPNRMAIYSNVFGVMGTAGLGYEIKQRRDILELAYAIVGLGKGDCVIDTIGNLGDRGEVFFAYLRVPGLVIDPAGIADVVERGLFVGTSFDGSLPNVIGSSSIRVVCENTLNVAMGSLKQAIKIKHTRNSEERILQAAEALQYVGAVEKQILDRAEKMLRVRGDKAMPALLEYFWPVDGEITETTRNRRLIERGNVWNAYEGEGNVSSSKIGENGWAAYNAVVEYWDHRRNVKGSAGEIKRATGAVLPGKWVDRKVEASRVVLGLVE